MPDNPMYNVLFPSSLCILLSLVNRPHQQLHKYISHSIIHSLLSLGVWIFVSLGYNQLWYERSLGLSLCFNTALHTYFIDF